MSPDEKDGDRGWQRTVSDAAPFLGIGSSLAATLGVCLWAGHWLDKRFGTGPIFFLVGGAVGMFAAAVHFYQMYRVLTDRKR